MGASPLSWLEIDAWCRMTQRSLTRFEMAALRRLDGLWLQEMSNRKASDS